MPSRISDRVVYALFVGLCLLSNIPAMSFPQQWQYRRTISLNGTWEISTDGGQSWSTTVLPHIAPDGALRYRRIIRMDTASLHQQWHLATLGLGDIAEIFLNGRYAAQLVSYGFPTSTTLPSHLWRPGENVLELRLSTELRHTSFFGPQRLRGCFRELFLLGTSSTWIQRLEAYARSEQGGRLGRVSTTVTVTGTPSPAEPIQLRIRLLHPLDSTTVAEQLFPLTRLPQSVVAQLELANPQLWSPRTPVLYTLLVELLAGATPIDGARTLIGFRSIAIQSNDTTTLVTCNGERLNLYGVEHYTSAVSLPSAQSDAEIELLLAAGITAVRLRGNLPHPEWLWKCAQKGIALIVDLPVTELPPALLRQPTTRFLLEHYLRLLTPLLANPAIIALTLWQGLPEHPAVTAYEQIVHQRLRPFNLLFSAELYGGARSPQMPKLPLLFVRLHPPFVPAHATEQELQRWIPFQQKGTALVPVGGLPIAPRSERGYLVPYSAEAQAQWIWQLLTLCKARATAGALIWSWQDYRAARPLVSFPFATGSACSTGIIADAAAGSPRPAYAALQAFLQGDLEPIIPPGRPPWGVFPMHTLWATALLLFTGWMLNRSQRLRHTFWRALTRSSSFFADLRDGRFGDYGTSLLCLGVTGLSLAAFGSVLQEWLRLRPPWVILLWQLTPLRFLQDTIGWFLPRPWAQLLMNFCLWLLTLIAFAAFFVSIARLLQRRLSWNTGLVLLTWSSVPLMLPLPLLLVGERLMQEPILKILYAGALGITALWSFWRALYALHIVLRLRLWTIVLSTFWGLALLGIITFGVYETSRSLSAYLDYVISLWGLP